MKKKLGFIRFKLIIVFQFLYMGVFAQTTIDSLNIVSVVDYNRPKEYEVAGIGITGVEFLNTDVLLNLSEIKVGDIVEIPSEKTTRAIQKFWNQGLFSDVKLYYTKIDGNKIYLEYYLKERPRLATLKIKGVRKSEITDLEEKIKLRSGSQITDDIISNTAYIIKKHYIDKGFFNVKVEMTQVSDSSLGNKIDLIIHIHKNPRVKIQSINISGNTVYKESKLRSKLKKTKQINLNIFKASKFIETDYKEDKNKLIEFYNKNGYRDARIISDSLIRVRYNRIRLEINIEEGIQYYFGDITWIGNTKYPTEYLNALLGIKKGDIYNSSQIEKRLNTDEDGITSLYMDNGYLFFSIDPVEVNVENDTIDLEMRIYEGRQARINNIIIKGNTKTNEHVVRRELRTDPGELFSKSDIIRSVRELAQLGHFNPENIIPNPIPDPISGTVDLEYQLEEKSNDQLEVSGGWGGGMFVGTLGITFSNFSARNILHLKSWRPVPTGDGQTLSLRAQTNGKYYQSYNMTFVEPWFGGKKPNSFSFSFYYSIYNPSSYSYLSSTTKVSDSYLKILGTSLGIGRRLTWPDDFFTLYTGISFQQYILKNYQYLPGFKNGTSNSLVINLQISRNSVDQIIYPRRGSSYSLALDITAPYSWFLPDNYWKLDENEIQAIRDNNEDATTAQIDAVILEKETSKKYNWIEYNKWTFKGINYLPITQKLILMTRAEFGFLGYYSKNWGYSPFEKFEVGGDGFTGYRRYGSDIVGLRGYENGSVVPEDAPANSTGNAYAKYTVELRYPISLATSATIYGLAFAEAGNCWWEINSFNPFSVKRSAGIGIRAFLPMFGMLGVDWGWGFDPIYDQYGRDKDVSGSQFHFVLGQQF